TSLLSPLAYSISTLEYAFEIILVLLTLASLSDIARVNELYPAVDTKDQNVDGESQLHGSELIILDRYACRLSPSFIMAWRGRLLNIYPSLLPTFCHSSLPIRDALQAGVRITGVTIHFIGESNTDNDGSIIAQTSSCLMQSEDNSFSSLNDSLPCPRDDPIIERISSSPTDAMMMKKHILQSSSNNFHEIELDDLDADFVDSLGLKLNLMLPVYVQWKKQFDFEDHEESNFITFIQQLKDEEIISYYTDRIIKEAEQWNDEHGCGVIDLIRYSIIDRLESKRQYPITPFDTSRQNQWIDQICESVRDGELSYMRRLKIYSIDDYLSDSNEKDLRNSMKIFENKTTDEQIFFYHGTTEIHAQSIVTCGIRLVKRGSRPGDFGFGFYTTNNLIEALRHAEDRSIATHGEQRPACLVFSISKNEFNAHQLIRLLYEEKEEEFIRE
ncbi:unnamed protein product, partial [Rotaria sordida]